MPRRLCIGQENNHYKGACTNEMPMLVTDNLSVCLSIPMALNTNAVVAIASALKGTQEEKEDSTGICVDRKHIVRHIKATFIPAKKNQLAKHVFKLPKAPSSDTKELSNTDTSLNDTLLHNEIVRAERRGIKPNINAEDGNEALSNATEEELRDVLSSSVDSLSVSEDDSPSSQTLSTLDSDSLSGSEPAKKKTRRTSVESSSPTQSNPVEGPSSESRHVYMQQWQDS